MDYRGVAHFWVYRLTNNCWAFLPIIPNPDLEINGNHKDAGTGTVPTDDGCRISVRFNDYADVIRHDMTATLAWHQPIDHAIDLETGFNLLYGQVYNLSDVELETLKLYIDTNLANGFIQQ
jgi:hypothetical protein